MDNKPIEIQVNLDIDEAIVNLDIDEAIEKANRLVELLREAQRLANSLAGRPEMDAKGLLNVLTSAYIDEMDKRWKAFEKMQL